MKNKNMGQLLLFPKSGVKTSNVGDEDLYPVRPDDTELFFLDIKNILDEGDHPDDMGISSTDFGDN